MASFGRALQSERLRRGLSLEEIARDTCLARHFLIALETEDVDSLPGGLYNRAYLRTYAEYLALDADSLVQAYDLTAKAQPETARSTVRPDALATMRTAIRSRLSERPRNGTPFAAIVRVGSVVLLATIVVWSGARYWRQRTETGPIGTKVSSTFATRDDAQENRVTGTASQPRVGQGLDALEVASETGAEDVQPQSAPVARLSVVASGVGTDVVDRQLIGMSNTFEVGTPMVFWTWVRGGGPGNVIRHVWIHQGRTVSAINLAVGGPSWRTYSRRTLRSGEEGPWVVEARDAQGRILARSEFRCIP